MFAYKFVDFVDLRDSGSLISEACPGELQKAQVAGQSFVLTLQ